MMNECYYVCFLRLWLAAHWPDWGKGHVSPVGPARHWPSIPSNWSRPSHPGDVFLPLVKANQIIPNEIRYNKITRNYPMSFRGGWPRLSSCRWLKSAGKRVKSDEAGNLKFPCWWNTVDFPSQKLIEISSSFLRVTKEISLRVCTGTMRVSVLSASLVLSRNLYQYVFHHIHLVEKRKVRYITVTLCICVDLPRIHTRNKKPRILSHLRRRYQTIWCVCSTTQGRNNRA